MRRISCSEWTRDGGGQEKRRRGENEGEGEGVIKSSNDLLIDEGPKLRPQITTEPENQSCVLPVCVGGPLCVEVSAQCSNFQPASGHIYKRLKWLYLTAHRFPGLRVY